MCSAARSTDGGGVLTFVLFLFKTKMLGKVRGKVIHGCSHILFFVAMLRGDIKKF